MVNVHHKQLATERAQMGPASATIVLMVGNAAAQALTAVAFIALARSLNVNTFGEFGSAYAFSTFCGSAIDFGASQVVTRSLATTSFRGSYWGWLRRRTLLSTISIPPLSALILWMWPDAMNLVSAVALATQSVLIATTFGLLAGVRARRTPVLAGWLLALGNLTFVIGCIAPASSPVTWAAVAAATSWLVTSASAAWTIRGRMRVLEPANQRNPWRGSLAFGVFALAAASQALVLPIVTASGGDVEGGEFAAVSRWVQPILLLPLAYSSFMYPRFSKARSYREVRAELRAALPMAAIATVLVIAGFVFSPNLVKLLLGDEYIGASTVLRLLLLASVPIIVGQPIATALQARGDERFVGTVTLATASLTLLTTAALSAWIGASAGAAAIGIGGVTITVANYLRLRGHLLTESPAQPAT